MPLKSSWLFPGIQSVHLAGIALLVGTIAITDLRLLGWVLQRYSVAEIRREFAPWTRAGLAIMLLTGPILFVADVARYSSNPAFLLKIAVLFVAVVFHFGVHNRTEPQRHARLVAIVSLALWTCVVLGGRAIADFDI